MVELLFIGIGFGIRFADTFGDNFSVALLVTRVFAVLALHTRRVFKKIPAQGAPHDVVELLKDKFVAVKLMNIFLALPDGSFTIESNIKWSTVFGLFRCAV